MSAPTPPSAKPAPPGRRLTRLMIVLLIAITVGPCIYVEAPRELARWYFAGARQERLAGNKEAADKRLAQALKWAPEDPDILLERARWRLVDGDYPAALADCQRVAEVRPDDFRTLFLRSLIFERLGRKSEAQADWKSIDRLSRARGLSREEWVLALVAIAEERQAGRKAEAYERLGMLISWSPGEPDLLIARAQWRVQDREFAAALDDCNAAAKLEPENPATLILRSEVLQSLGRHKEAIDDWQTLHRWSAQNKVNVDRTMVLNGLAYARAIGDLELDAGLKQVNEALEQDPEDAAILDTRGFLLYRLGKYEAALADMDAAVDGMGKRYKQFLPAEIDGAGGVLPSDRAREAAKSLAVVYYHRALVLEKLGRDADAKADRARAKELIGREPDETLF